jgi:hypothetical protein
MAVPYTFATASSPIPLANLDANFSYFAAAITVSGTSITVGGTVSATSFGGAINGTVGATTPNTGSFTTLAASSTVSGTGFSNYFASPPAIGGTAAAAGTFTTLRVNSTISLAGSTGTAGYVLTSNGASAPTWQVAASGGVTSVTATAPVASSGGTTPVISMAAATTSTNGYLTSTDWNTFNSKGSGTVTSVSGVAPVTSSGGATPAISMAAANTTTNGYLTSTDWNTFNGKGAGTVTSVGGTGTVNGLTLTGTVTSSGNLTLGGTLSLASPPAIGGTAPNAGTFTTLADAAGSVRQIPQSGAAKTTSYTLTTGDVGEFIQVGTGGSVTIPDATFAAGDAVSVFNNTTGNITITCTITTAYIGGTDTDKATVTLATRGVATILFISGTVCVITGNVT